MHHFYFTLLVLPRYAIHGSISSNFNKENVSSVSDTSRTDIDDTGPILQGLLNYFQNKEQDNVKDKKSAQNKAKILKKFAHEYISKNDSYMPSESTETESNEKHIKRHYFHIDPVFNSLTNRRKQIRSSSSDSELQSTHWKKEWNEKRLLQKFEAVNSSQPRGDVVNMKAARPWGVNCGDPNQYDMPWGTCMLPEECAAEYRIYRGDSFCGRNEFVCCAIERTAYDMYQGLDLSFQPDDSLSTDTEDEKPHNSQRSKETNRKHEKQKNKRDKAKLREKIRNSIRNIVREISRLLQRAYRNTTANRNAKTRELKDFIKKMKKQYMKDRNTVVDAHDLNMANYDIKFAESLGKIRDMNHAFLTNETFRNIVVNGTVNKEKLLKLQRTHPVLSLFFNHRRMGGGGLEPELEKIKLGKEEEVPEPENIKLHTEGEVPEPEDIKLEMEGQVPEPENIKLETERKVSEPEKEKNPKLLEYDLEYGMLYY